MRRRVVVADVMLLPMRDDGTDVGAVDLVTVTVVGTSQSGPKHPPSMGTTE